MNCCFHFRLHFPIVICVFLLFSIQANSSTDIDLVTNVAVGTRTGLFANVYTSGSNGSQAQVNQTGIVSSQANVAPGIVLNISTKRIRFATTYSLALSNNIAVQEEFRLNLYQNFGLQFNASLSRLLTLSAGANLRSGLLDYSTAFFSSVVDSEIPPNLLAAQELRFHIITTSLGLNRRWSRRADSSITFSFGTNKTTGYNESETSQLPNQYQISLNLNSAYLITRRIALDTNVRGAANVFEIGRSLLPIQARIGMRLALSEEMALVISAGLLAEYVLWNNGLEDENNADENPYLSRIAPLGNIEYVQQIYLKNQKTLRLRVSGTYDYYVDQLTVSGRQRLLFNIGLDLNITYKWRIATSGAFSSLVTPSDAQIATDDIVLNSYPTTAFLNFSVSYILPSELGAGSDLQINLGITSSARWAELGSEDFRARAFEEFIVYINISGRKRFLEP